MQKVVSLKNRDFLTLFALNYNNFFTTFFKVVESEIYIDLHILMKRLNQSYFDCMLIPYKDLKLIVKAEKSIMESENKDNTKNK